MSKIFFYSVLFYLLSLTEISTLAIIAILLFVYYLANFIQKLNDSIAFREYILFLFGLNYLLSPAIAYYNNDIVSVYAMKIPVEDYFAVAIPGMLCLQLGMYAVKTKIFNVSFGTFLNQTSLNQRILKQWLIVGVSLSLARNYVGGELAFFLYLISSVRYVAAYGLYVLDAKKYKWLLFGALGVEFLSAVQAGMFHDLVMWSIFFGIFWFYVNKPTFVVKMSLIMISLLAVFVLQISKSDYREKTWVGREEAGIGTFQEAVNKNMKSESGVFNSTNIANTLTRVNQGWILASTIKRMNETQDYQSLTLLKRYAEAGLLPRFVAPDKLMAGDKEIFNKFSGHYIGKGTSMGLGIMADGYIAYGFWGTLFFAFGFGLLFSLIFKVAEGWYSISPFFVLFIFPILNYAVRPDCETQTIFGHIAKALLVFGCVIWYYKGYFARKLKSLSGKERNREVPQLSIL